RFDDPREHHDRNGIHATDPQFSHRWVGQEFDLSDSLFQLIKYDRATLGQCITVQRRLDPPWAPVKKLDTDSGLQVPDCLGNGRLGHAEMRRCLGHTAGLHDREKYVQVPQPKAAADSALPINPAGHRILVISLKLNQSFLQYPITSTVAIKPHAG